MKPYYDDGAVTIYHGDCREVSEWRLAEVVVTDPPYGISYNCDMPGRHPPQGIIGDESTDLAKWLLDNIGDRYVVVFGANNWPQLLPHRGRWLCWDKRKSEAGDRMFGSPFELAWINTMSGYHVMVRVLHGGAVNANDPGKARLHPTEKPVALLRAIIAAAPEGLLADPFMGSGTTLRAAKDLGRRAIGVEIEERYCEIAARRCAQEVLPL